MPQGEDRASICRLMEQTPLIYLDHGAAIDHHFEEICREVGCTPQKTKVRPRNIARIMTLFQNEVVLMPECLALQDNNEELALIHIPSDVAQFGIYVIWDDHADPNIINSFCAAFHKK